MKKATLFFLVFFFGISCNKGLVKEPDSLIEREKMVNIMYDLALLEAMKIENPTLMDSMKYTSNQYIYKKYKIDSVQFAQSNIYYAADYEDYENMYKEIKTRLDNEKKQTNLLIHAQAKQEILKAKIKKKLKEKKAADSLKKVKQVEVSKSTAVLKK